MTKHSKQPKKNNNKQTNDKKNKKTKFKTPNKKIGHNMNTSC